MKPSRVSPNVRFRRSSLLLWILLCALVALGLGALIVAPALAHRDRFDFKFTGAQVFLIRSESASLKLQSAQW